MAGGVSVSTASTEAFRRRHGEEWTRLRQRLHTELQQDISRIFASSLYCDLELVFDSSSVQAHCCVLRARAAKFFSKLCSVAELRPLPNGARCVRLVRVPDTHIKNFLRNLYTKCSVAEEELEVIKQLEHLGWSADSDPSPDSDAYLTPYSSPSEAWPDLSVDLRSYYSIVPIDEDAALDSGSASPVLERELAEQDALLRSFQTIRSRDVRHKAKKPTSLPLVTGHCTRRQRQACGSRENKSKRAYLAVPNRDGLKNDFVNCEKSAVVNGEDCTCVSEVAQNEDVTEVSLVNCIDCCSKGAEDSLTFPLSPEMDGSAGGPDSGLDTCSTGFVPGGDFSSPRDYTVSETSGIDLTEAAAAGEEMPHDEVDQPKSSSSSVSSEAITWDIYVSSMCSETAAFIEAERKFSYMCMTGAPLRLDDEWCEVEDGLLSLSVPTDQVEHYCCHEHVGPDSELQSAPPVDPSPSDSTSSSNTQSSSAKEEPRHQTVTTSLAVSLSYPEAKTDWRITNGHNFFINAADLIDDSDTSLPYMNVAQSTEAKELIPVQDDSPLERSQCDIVDKGLSGYATVRSNFIEEDVPPVVTSADEFSEDFIPFLSSRPALDSIKDMMKMSGHETHPISDSNVASPPVKNTSQQASISRQSSTQDHTAEFQKEIIVVDRLEPYVETRKIVCKRKPGSVSTDASGSSLELSKFDQGDGRVLDENAVCLGEFESVFPNVVNKSLLHSENESAIVQTGALEEVNNQIEAGLNKSCFKGRMLPEGSEEKHEDLLSRKSENHVVVSRVSEHEDAGSTTKDEEAEKDVPVVEGECPRRASLIRRNTFELDPDDDRLALLRQEYERRQGNLLFQSCSPQFSGSDGAPDEGPGQLHSLPCLPSDGKNSQTIQTPAKSPHILPHVMGHEANTPDSLNNDGHIDSFFATQTKASGISEKICPGKDDSDHAPNSRVENGGELFPARSGSYSRSCKPVVSGALTCSDVVLDEKQLCDSPKKQKRTEATPIVSGGVAASDFVTPLQPKMDSPIFSRRKNELAPILSGGAVCVPKPEVKENKESMSVSIGSAWVVDMSDCSPNTARQSFDFKRRRRSEASHDVLTNPPAHEGQNSSLGFFVNLKDAAPEESMLADQTSSVQKDQLKKPKEFFINVGESSRSPMSRKKKITGERSVQKSKSQTDVPAKITIADDACEKSNGTVSVKNTMFSMFIDLGTPSKSKEKPGIQKDKTSTLKKVVTESVIDSESHSEDSNKAWSTKMNNVNNATFDAGSEPENQKSTYMFINTGPSSTSVQMTTPAKSTAQENIKTAVEEKKQSFFMFIETDSPVPRRKTLPSGMRPTFNRHSWNSDVSSERQDEEANCAQARVHKRAHSLSVDRSTLLEDGKPPLARSKMRRSSHSLHEDDSSPSSSQGKLPGRTQIRLPKQTRSLETDDAARTGSEKSLRSKQLSGSSTEVEDSTHSPGISLSTGPDEGVSISCTDPNSVKGNASSSATVTESEDRGKQAPAPKAVTSDICEEEKQMPVSFVKLSDLDKEPKRTEEDKPSPITTTNRMTRSIPETSWIESKLMMTRSIGGGSSINPSSRSLNRLFPHLHATGVVSQAPGKSPEPDEGDAQVSETSDLSSMQSSMGPSGLEGSTEETDASSSCAGRSAGPASRLGEDLLRMFLEEISPDVTVEVGGRRLRAHKCILSSRCQYFAAMLSGGWVESAGNVISLQGFSYNAVHFALCHIYSGTSNIPDTISIVELATLADMLGLEGLKEVIMYTLKVKYCHFFHKPCTMCAVGVVECLPLAAAYGLDDIYRKSLRWITRHFVRIWPTKGFASLPRELLDKCYQQHVVHMTADNVLETIMSCDKLLATLPSVRWAEPVFAVTSQLLEAAVKFLANNFCPVLNSESFQALGKELSWNISRLEDSLMAAADRLPPDQACQSHAHLHKTLTADQHTSQSFGELLRRLDKRVEASLVRQAVRAARCSSWSLMDVELRRKVQEAAFLVLLPGEDSPRPKQPVSAKRPAAQPRGSQRSSRSLDIRQVKLAMTQQARRVASGGRVSVLQADARTRAQSAAPGHRKQKSEPPPLPKKTEEKPVTEPLVRPKTWPLRVMEGESHFSEKVFYNSPSDEAGLSSETSRSCSRVANMPSFVVRARVDKYYSSKARPSRQGAGQPSASTPDKQGVVRRQGKTLISSSDSSRTSSPAMRRAASSGTRRKPGEVSAISVDSLTDEGSGRRTVSDGAMSKSLISTRPDTPSVVRKKRDETTMSADSLSEKVMPAVSVSAPSRSSAHTRPDTPPTKGKCRQALGRFASDGTISSDSLANTDSSPRAGVGEASSSPKVSRSTTKSSGDLQQRSPSMRRVAIRQSANSPRDSPAFRRNLATSGKLPAEGAAPKPAPAKSNKVAATLSPGAKRPAGKVTNRGNVKPVVAPVSSAKLSSRPASKVAPSRNSTKGPAPAAPKDGKKGCAVVNGHSKEEPQPPPTVGSRSGTFLKDEPTVIKLPAVKDLDE